MTRKLRIEQILQQHLQPEQLEILDESTKHHVPKGSETHFKVAIVSQRFEGLSRVARHQLVYSLLANELNDGLHALSLHLHTPIEWRTKAPSIPSSPACHDGYRH